MQIWWFGSLLTSSDYKQFSATSELSVWEALYPLIIYKHLEVRIYDFFFSLMCQALFQVYGIHIKQNPAFLQLTFTFGET